MYYGPTNKVHVILYPSSSTYFSGHASGEAGNFLNWDKNTDGVITREEVSLTVMYDNFKCENVF